MREGKEEAEPSNKHCSLRRVLEVEVRNGLAKEGGGPLNGLLHANEDVEALVSNVQCKIARRSCNILTNLSVHNSTYTYIGNVESTTIYNRHNFSIVSI